MPQKKKPSRNSLKLEGKMSKCVICGKELLTGDIHWAIGLCNACYNKTYKSDEQRYVDMLNKENSELLVNSLAEKDKLIAELQKQLGEKEKKIRQLDNEKGMLLNNSMKLLKEKDDKLKYQPAEIVENE